jgi:hypothetical protein
MWSISCSAGERYFATVMNRAEPSSSSVTLCNQRMWMSDITFSSAIHVSVQLCMFLNQSIRNSKHFELYSSVPVQNNYMVTRMSRGTEEVLPVFFLCRRFCGLPGSHGRCHATLQPGSRLRWHFLHWPGRWHAWVHKIRPHLEKIQNVPLVL